MRRRTRRRLVARKVGFSDSRIDDAVEQYRSLIGESVRIPPSFPVNGGRVRIPESFGDHRIGVGNYRDVFLTLSRSRRSGRRKKWRGDRNWKTIARGRGSLKRNRRGKDRRRILKMRRNVLSMKFFCRYVHSER
jgi:hypothetical protein